MIKDGQVRELRRQLTLGRSLAASARMTGMTEKTARDYRDDGRVPSQRKRPRNYRTRVDPFAGIWADVRRKLESEPALKAKTLFEWLQQADPGQFPDSTRRTFERRVALWRSLHGPDKVVYFGQIHHPGRLAASDFTVCNDLGVTIARARFEHILFHCVLTYSNVESISLCFSESFEALSHGIQKAFWEFGGVPQRHRTDSLSAAVRNHTDRRVFTDRYAALLDHYRCEGECTNARCANENGDVESSNGHLKDRIDQALMLRGRREFASRDEYVAFVEEIICRANLHRLSRFSEEQAQLKPLPHERLDIHDVVSDIRVSKSSTIHVRTNTYSVPSRLIGQRVDLRIGAEDIVVTHRGHVVQTMPRLVGKQLRAINYRHIIDSLVRKPGAFANYQYREEMFPTSQFRIAYDMLRAAHSETLADKTYVQILELAARESEEAVVDALRHLIGAGETITVDRISVLVTSAGVLPAVTDVQIEIPALSDFDFLLTMFDKECPNHDQDYGFRDHEACGENQSSEAAADRSDESAGSAASRASAADDSGSLSGGCDAGDNGEPQPSGVSVRTDDAGVRNASAWSHQTPDETIKAAVWQNLGDIQIRSTAPERDS